MGKAEEKIERYLKEQVESAGGLCWKISASYVKGIPDRLVILGETVLVEVKSSTGRLSAIQQYRQEQITKAGGTHYVVNSKQSVDDLVSSLAKKKEPINDSKNNHIHHHQLRPLRLGETNF